MAVHFMNTIIETLLNFRDERNWKQYHSNKNLSAALSIEASELQELFLWKTDNESDMVDKTRIEEELADILIYALYLIEKNNLDINAIIESKIKKNNIKYPPVNE